MEKNISVIFTGGTICTTINNGVMDTGEAAPLALIEFFKALNPQLSETVHLKPEKNFGILSENMTAEKWNEIAGYFAENIERFQECDGIIVAHGTDTLAYTTSLFSVLLKGFKIPVIFVSSNRPIMLEDKSINPDANGIENFAAAVECICSGLGPGIYATYKNPEDGRMYLHNGGHLIQCAIYDENFYSRDAVDITDDKKVDKLCLYKACDTEKCLLMNLKEKKLEDCILKINPYVGLNYDMFNLDGVRAVLHGTYHSGTACTAVTEKNKEKTSILYFFEKCAEKNIPFFYSPSLVEAGTAVYAGVPCIEHYVSNNQKIKILYGDTDELVYAKLMVAFSFDMPQEQLKQLLNYI